MCSHCFSDLALPNSRSSNNQGNINVCLKTTFFAWLKAMLTDMVAVVCGVEYERVVEESMLLQSVNEAIYKLVHCLECLQSSPVMAVVVLNVIITEFGLLSYPVCA